MSQSIKSQELSSRKLELSSRSIGSTVYIIYKDNIPICFTTTPEKGASVIDRLVNEIIKEDLEDTCKSSVSSIHLFYSVKEYEKIVVNLSRTNTMFLISYDSLVCTFRMEAINRSL